MLQFYILGDMGSGEISQYLVSNALQNHIKNKKTFVCGLGDNIYETGCTSINDEQFITKFEKPYENISDTNTQGFNLSVSAVKDQYLKAFVQ